MQQLARLCVETAYTLCYLTQKVLLILPVPYPFAEGLRLMQQLAKLRRKGLWMNRGRWASSNANPTCPTRWDFSANLGVGCLRLNVTSYNALRPYRAVVEKPTVAPKASAGALRGAWGSGVSPPPLTQFHTLCRGSCIAIVLMHGCLH